MTKSVIVIESGSTKADWACLHHGEVKYFQTKGLNPAVQNQWAMDFTDDQKTSILLSTDIYFYGAGVVKGNNDFYINQYFQSINPTIKVHVETDLTGAIIATAGHHPGIVCILGTGSHSCVFDGKKVIDSIPSLGYIISDEGTGNHIGREILKAYFYKEMTPDDAALFETTFGISRAQLLENLYRKPGVSAFLASFSPFLHKSSKSLKNNILRKCFEEFIQVRLLKYYQYLNFDLFFVGSIAHHFRDELIEALGHHQMFAKEIVERPLTKLIEYHK